MSLYKRNSTLFVLIALVLFVSGNNNLNNNNNNIHTPTTESIVLNLAPISSHDTREWQIIKLKASSNNNQTVDVRGILYFYEYN